jgi:hypothetical protein
VVVWEAGQQPLQIPDQASNRSPVAARELGRIDEDKAVMRTTSLVSGIRERDEVRDVLGDNGSSLLLSQGEDRQVRQ